MLCESLSGKLTRVGYFGPIRIRKKSEKRGCFFSVNEPNRLPYNNKIRPVIFVPGPGMIRVC
jgi:hypothetical protein